MAAALRAHALTRGGAVAAFAIGTLTFGAGGWPFTFVLLAFFIPSVALSRVGRKRKKTLVDIGKDGARDAWQVLANGGAATACAVIAAMTRTSPAARPISGAGRLLDSRLWMAAFAGAYAAATADTWGTEIGTLVSARPRSILTLHPIPTGLSGGVTLWGTLAELAGSVWLAAATISSVGRDFAVFFVPIALAGFAGATSDSLLGATLQELRRCPVCDRTCETNPHVCGSPTALVRGVGGWSNDIVNGAASCVGAILAGGLVLIVIVRSERR